MDTFASRLLAELNRAADDSVNGAVRVALQKVADAVRAAQPREAAPPASAGGLSANCLGWLSYEASTDSGGVECYAQEVRAHIATLEARNAEQAKEIAKLNAEITDGYEAGWHALRNERDHLRAELAAAREQLERDKHPRFSEREFARITKERDEARDALKRIDQIEDRCDGGVWGEIEQARKIAREALRSMPKVTQP